MRLKCFLKHSSLWRKWELRISCVLCYFSIYNFFFDEYFYLPSVALAECVCVCVCVYLFCTIIDDREGKYSSLSQCYAFWEAAKSICLFPRCETQSLKVPGVVWLLGRWMSTLRGQSCHSIHWYGGKSSVFVCVCVSVIYIYKRNLERWREVICSVNSLKSNLLSFKATR